MKGRPTDYNQEIADRICQWIAGGQSLRAFCRKPKTPALSTVCLWIVTHEEFSEQYKRAREAAGYAHADNIVDVVKQISDDGLDPNAARAMMDGLKWAAERMAPKAHMPQSMVNHKSPDGSMSPKPTEIIVRPADDKSDG